MNTLVEFSVLNCNLVPLRRLPPFANSLSGCNVAFADVVAPSSCLSPFWCRDESDEESDEEVDWTKPQQGQRIGGFKADAEVQQLSWIKNNCPRSQEITELSGKRVLFGPRIYFFVKSCFAKFSLIFFFHETWNVYMLWPKLIMIISMMRTRKQSMLSVRWDSDVLWIERGEVYCCYEQCPTESAGRCHPKWGSG